MIIFGSFLPSLGLAWHHQVYSGRGSRHCYAINRPILRHFISPCGSSAVVKQQRGGACRGGAIYGGFSHRPADGDTFPKDDVRLVKRLVARELTLSFVPDPEQRLWRTVTRKKYQLRRDVVRLHNQLEALLEEAHIKLSSLVSDLLGVSARRMLKALAAGETNPAALAALAHERLRVTPEQLCDALGACRELKPVYRRLLKVALEQLQLLEQQIGQLYQELATLLIRTRM